MLRISAHITRAVLTLIWVYLVYRETGFWTAGALFLCWVGIECHDFVIRRMMLEKKKIDI